MGHPDITHDKALLVINHGGLAEIGEQSAEKWPVMSQNASIQRGHPAAWEGLQTVA